MPNVYSKLFWRAGPTAGGGGGLCPTPIPAGFVWDVRSISAMCIANPFQPLKGITWGDNSGQLVAAIGSQEAYPNRFYSLDLRQILDETMRLTYFSDDVGWYFRICGYQLTLP